MNFIDFSNRKNRFIGENDVPDGYALKMRERVNEDKLYYPNYHIAPKHGLLNDPNGLYQDDEGNYHIYYQWFPYGTVHGLKHWYHLSTKNFIDYKSYGIALFPDTDSDSHGCYTGMTFRDGEKINVYYTGIRKEGENLVPTSIHGYIKNNEIHKTGVVQEVDLLETTYNYRDPFVFKKENKYYAITGAESTDHKGILLLSESNSTETTFKNIGTISLKDEELGYMLECPNYVEIEDKGLMIFSPQGIESDNKYDYRNVFSVVYALGDKLDVEICNFEYDKLYELDKGFDFYAPQIFKDNLGREILYGWLGNSKCEYPSDKYQWTHMLTLPREVSLVGGRVSQRPLLEIFEMRKNKEENINGKSLTKRSFAIEFEVENGVFCLENDQAEYLEFIITETEYCLNRETTTHLYNEQYGQKRYAHRESNKKDSCYIFVDQSAIEIFVDNGVTAFTSRFYLDGDWKISSKGFNFDYYDMLEIEVSELNKVTK